MRKYPIRWLLMGVLAAAVLIGVIPATTAQTTGWSLRYFGNGTDDIDRVKIRLDAPARAVDVGGDFTIEFFMRANAGENGSGTCNTGNAGWINGNTIIDRDVFGNGDNGDYGISLYGGGGVIAFGVSLGASGDTLCGSTNVADSNWHHIAVTRSSSTGQLQLFVDGVLDGTATGPTGDISYRNGRETSFPNDPFLVIGAEKHDAGGDFPSFSGWVDELRISTVIRYTGTFTVPTAAFSRDGSTVGLYHFDEGSGNTINDVSGTGSHGVRQFGGSPAGPAWANESPLPIVPVPRGSGSSSSGSSNNASGQVAQVEPPSVLPCYDMNTEPDGVLRADLPAYRYEVHCRVLVVNGTFFGGNGLPLAHAGQVGDQAVLDAGVLQAVDVFSPTGVKFFDQGAVICLRGSGQLLFMSSSQAPRRASPLADLPGRLAGYTCGALIEPGTLVLVGSLPSSAAAAQSLTACSLTTTHRLNLRTEASINSAVLTLVPFDTTLAVLAVSGDWYQVVYEGRQGWLAAQYVRTQGNCAN